MRPEQLGDFVTPSDAHLHPDGQTAAFVVTQMDLDEDQYVSQIWLHDGSDAAKLTTGRSDSSPRWSPDGTMLAFLRKGPGPTDRPQLALLPKGGGEAKVVTDFELGVSRISWSPDGSQILLEVSEYVDGIDDEDERVRAPRRITDPSFRFDAVGWTYLKRTHLWIYSIDKQSSRQLTEGDANEREGTWNPDGSTIAFLSAVDDDRWISPLGHVFTVAVDGGTPVPVTPKGGWGWVGYSPSGELHVIGRPLERMTLDTLPLQRVHGDGSLQQLTDLDRDLQPGHPPGLLAGPRFLEDGTIHTLLEDRGSQRVIAIGVDGEVADVVGGNRLITGWDPDPSGTTAVFTATSPTEPGEVYLWDGEKEVALTDFNRQFAEDANLSEPVDFTYESDGEEIHGWVVLPDGDESVPTVLMIHGGPAAQYGWGFFDEFQVLAGAGYGVVAVNPRGSSGYGEAHKKVPIGRWADPVPPDQADLMEAPFAASRQFPRLDTDRLGIMGGSYGGLSTIIITSLDDRYRSAVAERGVYNFVSFGGTTDIPWFTRLYLDRDVEADADGIWRASALARATGTTTPTLVIHSEGDYRTPVEQGQQLFMLLYRQGVETELLLFPADEGHELSRSGKPRHRVERFDAILQWHARYLGDDRTGIDGVPN